MTAGGADPIDDDTIVEAFSGGRRARQREALRNKIYAAAIELLTTQGYDATTIDAIAARADVARNTVFNHFPQKVNFLQEWGLRRRAITLAALQLNDAHDVPAAQLLRRCMNELAALSTANRHQTVMVMDAAARHSDILRGQPLAAVFAPIVAAGQAKGEFSTKPQPDLVGAVLAGIYFTTLLRWIAVEPAPFDLATELDAMLDIVFTGL